MDLAPTLTLADIAVLADVRRPVVSVWRGRSPVGVAYPFPPPVAVRGTTEHFDADEVVTWLERTGRGNNPDARADAAAVALPPDVTGRQVVPLLALTVAAQRPLAGLHLDELTDLADEVDPDDELLLREVRDLGADGSPLPAAVDGLLAASLGPADALDRLQNGRLRREARVTGLTQGGADVVATLCTTVADHLGPDPVVLVDATGGRDPLALGVASRWPEGRLGHLVLAGETAEARAGRRASFLRGVPLGERGAGPAVHLLTVLGLSPADAVEQIDDAQLELSDDDVLVVVGAAAVLCDKPREKGTVVRRADVLRSGTVRVAVRLPRGLRRDAPRQETAVWVMAARAAHTDHVAVADLSGAELTSATIEQLAMDAVGALADVRRHAFSHALVQPAARLLARDVLVPYGVRAQRTITRTPAQRLVDIEQLSAEVTTPVVPPPVAVSAGTPRTARPTTLGRLVAERRAALIAGARIDPDRAEAGGAVRLADPVHGESTHGFDRLDLAALSATAVTTEPGDVVVTHTPRPAAWVDTEGGHVVAFPARVVRLDADAAVGPNVLAAVVNGLPATARDWGAWPVPDVPAEERDALDRRVAELADHRATLLRHAHATADLIHHLTDAVAAGAATLTPEAD